MAVTIPQKNGAYPITTEMSQGMVKDVMKALALGHDRQACILMLRDAYGGTIARATSYVDSVIATVFHFDTDWTARVVAQTRLAINLTLQQVEDMYEEAEDGRERVEALKLKLKALGQLRDLAPRQVELQSVELQAAEVRRKLFEVHNIDPDLIEADE